MTIQEIEERLRVEESYLDHAIIAKNPIAIALAEAGINEWSRLLREARINENGGYHA